MAVIFQKKQGNDLIEVRSAGNSVRLYSNGVLHSQYNPNHKINGAIWDLLVLPGFFLAKPPRHVLVLGLGGGTVIHLIRHFFPQCNITCIEREALHIEIAKRYFKIPNDITVIKGDAYVELSKLNSKFDWVLDDVFQHVSGEPEREVAFDDVFSLYENVLSKNGVLSMNTIGKQQLNHLRVYKPKFESAYIMRHPLYDNGIVSLNRSQISKTMFFDALMKYKELDKRRKTCRLKVGLRQL
ncbi:hypothetical protein NBRC116188_16580 [Oceaniserpentilla sp. 4NH20-0058]|uniref:spermidine synthase n=1 Tax=Oceaniserpentilla sp. 4NH20-0058 TaxID=3127660 RepID=UPI003102E79A